MQDAATSSEAPAEGHTDPRREKLAAAGKRYIVRDNAAAVISLALALGAARSFVWYDAWLYAGVLLAVKVTTAVLLVRHNPAVLNARGTKQSTSAREKWFFAVFVPTSLGLPIVAGLDAGGPGWTYSSVALLVLGLLLVVAGASLVVWALVVNAFFEPTVRLQSDRGHRVCTAGPYRFVRHPGYTGAVLAMAGVPLALGSAWAAVPWLVGTVAFIVRIRYEEALLQAELDGYEDYARTTRYRLLPGVW